MKIATRFKLIICKMVLLLPLFVSSNAYAVSATHEEAARVFIKTVVPAFGTLEDGLREKLKKVSEKIKSKSDCFTDQTVDELTEESMEILGPKVRRAIVLSIAQEIQEADLKYMVEVSNRKLKPDAEVAARIKEALPAAKARMGSFMDSIKEDVKKTLAVSYMTVVKKYINDDKTCK